MYSSNVDDFWFDIYTLFSCNIIYFVISIILIVFIYTLIYCIGNIFKNTKNLYNILLLIGFVFFIVSYIQGNYLSSSLPVLNGDTIIWSNYKTQMIISAILLLVAIIAVVICTIKFKYEKVINILKYITLAILIMLLVSLISTCLTKKCFVRKTYPSTATTKNISNYSSNKNFIIFLLDAVDSKRTQKIIDENPEYQNIFTDFTYYPDTVSGYVFTRDSIPLILSGIWSENKTDFATFSNEAMDQSRLLEMLKEKKYNINIYDEEIKYNTENAKVVKNFSFDNNIDSYKYLKQELKYDLFKYLPFYLKKFSKIETMDFIGTRKMVDDNMFSWENTVFYNNYLNQNVKLNNQNEFKFIHIEGGHTPFDCDENLQPLNNNGTYEQKVQACLKIIDKYLNYLKENNVYDNSVIIVMADHGYEYETEHTLFRQNPIFYIKGINEKHEARTSNEKVSFDYLMDIYKNLLDDKESSNALDNIDNSGPRRLLLHETYNYDHLTEYMQYGVARDYSTTIATGNKFYLDD